MQKYYLMAPGPTAVPESVLLEMANPVIHHRTVEFERLMARVRSDLQWLFQTKEEVLILASVGSGALESALTNCFSPGDKVIAIVSGKFGERWAEMAQVFDLNTVVYNVEWGKAARITEVQRLLKEHPDAKGLITQACETSTGVQHPIEEIAQLVRNTPTLLLVDGITAVGISDLPMDRWGIDVLLTGSQKALMLPPGLAMVSLSAKAWSACRQAKGKRYYFNYLTEAEAHRKNQTHFTPAISLIRGLAKSLELLKQEGLEALFKRHARLAAATRAGAQALGLEVFSESAANSVTVISAPKGISGDKIVQHLQTKYNVTIMGGQDHLKSKIFRIGHMGYCGDFDIVMAMSAVEMTLKDLGHPVDLGRGVGAAMRVLHENCK